MPFQYAIVGFGPAGIFALASLPFSAVSSTLIFEPGCVGGDLAALYGSIKANIPKSDIVKAFRNIPRWSELSFSLLDPYKDDDCPLLADVCKQMREMILPDMKHAHFHAQKMIGLQETETGWKLQTSNAVFEVRKVLLCTGSKPRTLNLPKASIPLSIALVRSQLDHHISPKDSIVVFGTAHSGTIVLKNLKDLGCKHVHAVYHGPKPFRYARLHEVGGVKQESATIADEILAKAWGESTPTLINYDDFVNLYRIVHSADIVIYAIGFEQTGQTYTNREGVERVICVDKANNLWGFGIAFAKEIHEVGFNGFITAIQAALPDILR